MQTSEIYRQFAGRFLTHIQREALPEARRATVIAGVVFAVGLAGSLLMARWMLSHEHLTILWLVVYGLPLVLGERAWFYIKSER